MPKNKEMFPWILHALDTAPMPPRVYKPQYLLVKDPVNIPFNSNEELKDPRLDYYSPRTSPSLTQDYSELSELDAVLCIQLETEGFTTTSTEEPTDDTALQAQEEETPATEWIILDSIGTIDDF